MKLNKGTPEIDVDRLFAALANPTRRRVVERLSARSASVSELAKPFDMALPSFVQHLQVLEEAGLIRSTKEGRVRTYRIEGEALGAARDWLERQRALWEARLDRLDAYVTHLKEEGK
jgi:DNA-binding transcriptional ArsR family regulator